MSKAILFRVMNAKGEFSGGGTWPSFTSKGKVWVGRASFMNHVTQTSYDSGNKTNKHKDNGWQIIETHIDFAGQTCKFETYSFNDLVDRLNRKRMLDKKYGTTFSILVDRIEKNGLQADFKWCLVMPTDYQKEAITAVPEVLKRLKLKQNTHYSRSFSTYDGAIAFKSKEDALRVRLALPGKVESIDITNYLSYDN